MPESLIEIDLDIHCTCEREQKGADCRRGTSVSASDAPSHTAATRCRILRLPRVVAINALASKQAACTGSMPVTCYEEHMHWSNDDLVNHPLVAVANSARDCRTRSPWIRPVTLFVRKSTAEGLDFQNMQRPLGGESAEMR